MQNCVLTTCDLLSVTVMPLHWNSSAVAGFSVPVRPVCRIYEGIWSLTQAVHGWANMGPVHGVSYFSPQGPQGITQPAPLFPSPSVMPPYHCINAAASGQQSRVESSKGGQSPQTQQSAAIIFLCTEQMSSAWEKNIWLSFFNVNINPIIETNAYDLYLKLKVSARKCGSKRSEFVPSLFLLSRWLMKVTGFTLLM